MLHVFQHPNSESVILLSFSICFDHRNWIRNREPHLRPHLIQHTNLPEFAELRHAPRTAWLDLEVQPLPCRQNHKQNETATSHPRGTSPSSHASLGSAWVMLLREKMLLFRKKRKVAESSKKKKVHGIALTTKKCIDGQNLCDVSATSGSRTAG